MKFFLITVLLFANGFLLQAQNPAFYNGVNHIMNTYVHNGMVNYSALKDNPAKLAKIVELIKATDLKTLTDDEFVAFVINAYNMLVIYNVVTNYPAQSPLKIKGFFSDKSFSFFDRNSAAKFRRP